MDTVPFGAFPRSLIDEIGGFDETLLSNEDYEFNTRIRKSGGRIWLDPQIRSIYFARKNLKELAKQYWRYGFWKSQMLKRYPETLRYRQAIPPLFVAGILILFLAGLIYRPFLRFFVLAVGLYLLTLLAIGIQLAILKKDILLIIGAPLATMTMHFAWGQDLSLASSRERNVEPTGAHMQATTTSHRWRFKTSEQRFILIFGDLFAGGLALMLALYFWAAGDEWMKLSMEFLRTRPRTGSTSCRSSGLFFWSRLTTSLKPAACRIRYGALAWQR